jgi:hypothetical protein
MGLVIDSLPLVLHGRRSLLSELSGLAFLTIGERLVAHISFDWILVKGGQGEDLTLVGESAKDVIWALQTFKYNNWEVEIFSSVEEVSLVKEWVSRNGVGLVDRVSLYSTEDESLNLSVASAFKQGLQECWLGKGDHWREVMMKLNRRGFFKKGLLPLEKGERANDMVAMLKEPVFRDLVSDLKGKKTDQGETRDELIKSIEGYIRHPEILDEGCDLLVRARAEGGLLESVLRLLARDQVDPVGCIILAQQDRETSVDQVSPMFEVGID